MQYTGASVGQIVHFVFRNVRDEIVKRPAIVVDLGDDKACSLNVFVDGSRDMASDWHGQVLWRCDVPYDPEDSGMENSWVFPRKRGI